MGVGLAAVDDPLSENFRNDLANALDARRSSRAMSSSATPLDEEPRDLGLDPRRVEVDRPSRKTRVSIAPRSPRL